MTALARGQRKAQLEAHGSWIRHHLQRSQTLDMETCLICHLAAILPIDDLVACGHGRHICKEMEMLDAAFMAVIARMPDAPMPRWHELKGQMPGRKQVRRQYGQITFSH